MQEQMKGNSSILEKFEFRDIRQEEADQAVLIEKICSRQMKHVLRNT